MWWLLGTISIQSRLSRGVADGRSDDELRREIRDIRPSLEGKPDADPDELVALMDMDKSSNTGPETASLFDSVVGIEPPEAAEAKYEFKRDPLRHQHRWELVNSVFDWVEDLM